MTTSVKHLRAFAVLAVAICLISVIPFDDVSADSNDYYRYVIHPDGTVEGNYTSIGTSATSGSYTSTNNTNSGSWTWNDAGYGPFNSFYAAFSTGLDAGQRRGNMICHLDPDDLTKSVDGSIDISGKRYNVMWCLPTVYWLTDSDGNLILTDDPNAGGVAYAHTIDGHVYNYIGIGVYEASLVTFKEYPGFAGTQMREKTLLMSSSDKEPAVSMMRSEFRQYASYEIATYQLGAIDGHSMLWNFYQWQLYRFCTIAVMGSWDSQSVAGNGNVYDTSMNLNLTGELDSSGPYAGTTGGTDYNGIDFYQDPVKVFIENAWGNCWEYVDGIVVNYWECYIDTSATPTDSTSGESISSGGVLPNRDGCGSNPSTVDNFWGMPTSINGSDYFSDLCDYIDTNYPGPFGLAVGGYADYNRWNAKWYGISAMGCVSMNNANSMYGTRIAMVFDNDPFAPETHTVTFSTGSESLIPNQVIEDGDTALAPSNPALEGYVFDCWSTSSTSRVPYDFNTPVTQDLALYAVWVETLVFTTTPTSQGTVSAVPNMAGTILCDAAGSRDYTSLLWDLGDGTLSTDNYVTHYYSEPGTYTVTLTTYNSQGADVTTFTVEVPEAPGGEDGNDVLLWVAIGLLAVLIVIVVVTRLF